MDNNNHLYEIVFHHANCNQFHNKYNDDKLFFKQHEYVISSLDIDAILPDTPVDEGTVANSKIPVSTISLTAYCIALSLYPVVYQGENQGRLIRHVVPRRNAEKQISSHGSLKTFSPHIEIKECVTMFIEGSLLAEYFYIGLMILVLASLIAGYIDAVAGGAGLILIPVFLMIGLPPHFALGQEKLVSTVGTLSAIRNFIKNSAIVWVIVPTGIFFALLGAFIGAKAILWLPTDSIHYVILVMLPIGLLATLKGKIQDTNSEKTINERAITKSLLVASLVCLLVGFYDGFFGPGAGSFFIIALCLFNNMTLLKASATAKIFNFSSNIGAFVAFLMAGQMAFTIGCPMMIASLLGNHLGSLHAIKSDGKIIKKVLMLTVTSMMITLGYKLVS